MSKADRIAKARARVAEQRRWIEEHGGDLGGYLARYGSKYGPEDERQGDGGEAIYAADRAELETCIAELQALTS